MSFPVDRRGGVKRALPSSFTSANNFGLAPPADFGVQSPPGGSEPSTAWSGVPGVQAPAFSGPSNPLGVPAVTAVSGFRSQELQTQSHVVKPWENGYDTRLGRGQALFCARNTNTGNDLKTIVSLPQINEILRKAYKKALDAGVLERVTVDAETFDEFKNGIEEDLEDGVARQRRYLDEKNADAAARTSLVTRLLNTNEKFWLSNEKYRELILSERATTYLKYLSLPGILESWNYIGVLGNAERAESEFKVLNTAFSGPIEVDNYWGDAVRQSSYVYLTLKRTMGVNGDYRHFAVTPWAERLDDSAMTLYGKYPSAEDLHYEDSAGYEQQGMYFTIGKIGRVDSSTREQNRSGLRLAGVADDPRAEQNAWRETNSAKKSKVFVTLGRDPWDKAGY